MDSDAQQDKIYKFKSTIEQQLTIIGATAIEDKLQENLIQTLNLLKVAKIKTWVITGDKTETAKNIAYSSELFDKRFIPTYFD